MLKHDYIQLDLDCSSQEEVIRKMAQVFIQDGVVKESYLDAVLQREKKYPTGLPAEAFAIAVPHAEAVHSNHAAISVGVLRHPIPFHQMGSPEIVLNVEMLFMLAVDDPHEQIEFLKSMMRLIQDKETLLEIKNTPSKDRIAALLEKALPLQ